MLDILLNWIIRNVGRRYIIGAGVAVIFFFGYEQYCINMEQQNAIEKLKGDITIVQQIRKDIEEIKTRQQHDIDKLDRKLDKLIDYLIERGKNADNHESSE